MKRTTNKILSVVLAVLMVVTMFPVTAFAADAVTGEKVAVTAASDIVPGNYFISGTSSFPLGDGTTTAFMSTKNSTETRLMSSNLTVAEGKVSSDDANCIWELVATEGGFFVKNAGNGKYLYYGSNSGNNIYQTENLTEAGVWKVVSNDNGWTLEEVGSQRQLSCNRFGSEGSQYLGFSSYAITSGSMKTLEFYKISGDITVPEDPKEPEDPEVPVTANIADGEYVIWDEATGKAATALESSYGYLKPVEVALSEGVLTGYSEAEAWTVENAENGKFIIKDSNGKYVYMNGTYNSFNVSDTLPESGYLWTAEEAEDGKIRIKNVEKEKYVAYDTEYNSFGSYPEIKATHNDKLTLTPYVKPVEVSTIAEALAGENGTEFTVKGVVTLVDGANIYVQDATGGIDGYMKSAPSDIALGDTIIVTGKRAEYKGLPELASATYTKSSGLTLEAKTVAIDELTAADICTYIEIKAVTVTEVYDKDGTYSTPNITVEDEDGNKIQLYKAVINKVDGAWEYEVGDVLNIKAAVGVYNTTLQLRNTLAEEVSEVKEPAVPDGDYVIWVPAYEKALSAEKTGYYNVGVDVYLEGEVIKGYSGTEIWTVTNNADGSVTIENGGQKLSMAAENSSMTMDAVNDTWEIIPLGEGLYNVKNVGRGSYMEWYNKYSNWSTYNSKYAATDDQFQIAFAPVAKDRYAKLDNELVDGDQVLIYYNADSVVVTDVPLDEEGKKLCVAEAIPTADDFIKVDEYTTVFDVSVDENGYVTFTSGGKYLTSGETGNKLYMADAPSDYSLWVIKAVEGGVHVVNANAAYYGKAQALEYYGGFTTYSEKDNEYYLFNLYTLTDEQPAPAGTIIEGAEVVIYNLSAEGVLANENDQQSIENAPAWLTEEMKAVPENGAVIFKVIKNGEYYRFYNETYGYLCSNGTGNNAFYSLEESEDADWKVTEGKKGGYNLESRIAKYNGSYSQFLEYYSDSYKSYSMYNVTDYDIYEFFFYPVDTDIANVTNGIVNNPQFVLDAGKAYLGQDWVVTFTVDAVFGIEGEIEVLIQGDPAGDGSEGFNDIPDAAVLTGPDGEGKYTVTVSAENVAKAGKGIAIDVTATDKTGYTFGNWTSVSVIDEPSIGEVSPAVNSETGDDKRPVISAEIINAGEDATVILSVNAEAVEAVYADGKVTYTPSEDLPDGRTSVLVSVERADGLVAEKAWSFTVGEAQYQLYFGQLHSHTTYSDGSGSLESALDYVAGLPESANVDFVAFTDHSNYFDTTSEANPEEALYDMSLASEYSRNMWNDYKSTIATFNNSQTDVIAIGGFEMTWSGGPGHINTFNTEGIVSRNNTTLNNKTSDAGMKAYYALLSQAEGIDSLSQFNHPGSTFGTFTDFAYWDAVVDTRIQMVEVGNGEGQIGAGGYYPSYEYYVMALDKGWHVAPTNNQDNHKGKWGNGNDARDVILTDNFTEEGIYQAIRDMRMYATEDKNLEIGYTVNGKLLGSTIEEVPEKLNINVTVYDPDASDSISKVEVVVNSGKTAYTWDDPAVLAAGELTAEIDPAYSYYFIRVTEGDGDLAVTAPVWVGESLKLGISSFVSGTSTPVTSEELTLTTTLFNSEESEATVKALTYSIKGGEVIGTDTEGYTVPAFGTSAVEFKWTPETAKVTTVTVTAVVELDGEEYTFTMDIELDVQDAEKLVYIGIDASHYNEYVNGNYKDSMGNFGQLAAEYGVRTVTLYKSEDLIAACSNPKYKALILTAPSRRSSEAQSADPLKVYTEAELEAIKAFNAEGGIVILAGWSDHYENYPDVESIKKMKAEEHMAATQNAVLEALGSSLRIGDDATYDDDYNGGQAYRLYFNTYGEGFLTERIEVDPENPHDRLYTEVFSHYGGASVYTVDGTLPSTVSPVVFGHSGTYSVDVDNDGLGGSSMYKYTCPEGDERLMIMATEQLEGKGLIIVSGAAFMSNFEVQATIEDNGSEKNYSNYKVCENLLAYINPVTISDIADVQAEKDEGVKFTVEGIVTSNASGYDKNTAFFDCIYVQDETAGINAFPVAGNFKIGDKVRVSGTTSSYNGERQLNVTSIEKVGEETPVTPKEVSAKDINDGSVLGSLVTIKGVVESYAKENGLVQTIMVKDAKGQTARVFIDGYITTDKDVQNLRVGSEVVVTGLASYDNSFDGIAPRIRIRNRADVAVTGYSGGIGGEGENENVSNIIINMNGKTEGEANPETGAPVYSAFSGIAVLAAAAFVLGKRR